MKHALYFLDATHESKLGLSSDTMPIQLGLVASHCLKDHGDLVEVEIFKYLRDLEQRISTRPPLILAVSNYLWNFNLGYEVASIVKKELPHVLTVFGGPNYPDDRDEQIDFLREHPNIDVYIYKDGELPFSNLVSEYLKNPVIEAIQRARLPSCHALVDGEPCFGDLMPRLADLSQTPSPYTAGLMDKFFEENLIPPIQSNRGCPFPCTYCTEGGRYYNKVYKGSLALKKENLDAIVQRIKHTGTLRITDSNFGMFPEDVEFCEYMGEVRKRTGYPDYLTCSTGKNCKERVLRCNELLGNIMRFTASVQSLNQEVLRNVRRTNISLDQIVALSDQVSDTDTHSYSEIILGLPGDSMAAQIESFSGLIASGISNITQHQLALIHGTEVASRKSREKWRIRGMFRPIQRCVGVYDFFGRHFPSVDIEEICVANSTMTYEDYLEARRLYLTVGLFYNDRVFGEIHGLLRILQLPTWDWLWRIHQSIPEMPPELQALYEGFTRDTRGELWETREQLVRDVTAEVERYASGELGGNLIYKYRSMGLIERFAQAHDTAYAHLRAYLADHGVDCADVVEDLERFSQHRKGNLLDTDLEIVEAFDVDVLRILRDVKFARDKRLLDELRYRTRVRIAHSDKQKETLHQQLDFYGRDIGGLTMLLSRYPVKRFYRQAEPVG
ncbi:MAG: hypothetical protein Kow0092_17130 [Deferrisomatales bacterium]